MTSGCNTPQTSRDVWFEWFAPSTDGYDFAICGVSWAPVIEVYVSETCPTSLASPDVCSRSISGQVGPITINSTTHDLCGREFNKETRQGINSAYISNFPVEQGQRLYIRVAGATAGSHGIFSFAVGQSAGILDGGGAGGDGDGDDTLPIIVGVVVGGGALLFICIILIIAGIVAVIIIVKKRKDAETRRNGSDSEDEDEENGTAMKVYKHTDEGTSRSVVSTEEEEEEEESNEPSEADAPSSSEPEESERSRDESDTGTEIVSSVAGSRVANADYDITPGTSFKDPGYKLPVPPLASHPSVQQLESASEEDKSPQTHVKLIAWKELKLREEPIGTGAFGTVYRGKWRGASVAVKLVNLPRVVDKAMQEDFHREARLMQKLGNHPNVMQLIGVVAEPGYYAIVMPYCRLGSLHSALFKRKEKFSKKVLIRMARDAAAGILSLHCEKVIHRDIAARNILLAENYKVLVTDFGLSRIKKEAEAHTKSNLGPVRYMAPEAITRREYSEASDAFSFGVLLWEMVTRKEPWEGETVIEVAVKVGKEGKRLKIPDKCDPCMKELMEECWQENPADRPDFQRIHKKLRKRYKELGGSHIL